MQVFQVRQRGAANSAQVAALSASSMHELPKHWNTCMEHNGDYIET
jgi:hypothetical protein